MKSRLIYFYAFIKAITLLRLRNIILVKATYYWSRFTRKAVHRGMPISISIEPTTSCNLKCPECPSGLRKFTRPTGFLTEETMKIIAEQLADYLIYVTFYFQGEPLLHKEFGSFIKMLGTRKIVTGTSTNAHYLTTEKGKEIIESGLDRLIVSVDGADADTYKTYRQGGDFDKVIHNIESFMVLRKKMKSLRPFVELQFIVFKHNEHQINEIKTIGKKLGVDLVVLKTAQLYEFEKGNPLMPGLVKYARYTKEPDGFYRIKGSLPNKCNRSWSGSVVTWDGQVIPCCFDKDAQFKFGNLHQTNYKTILKNPDYSTFRQQILSDRSKIDICRNCTEGLR